MSTASVLNTLWMLQCTKEAWAFGRATRRVARTQATVLAEIVSRNRDTEYGRRFGFASIRTPRDFQVRVPLTAYADYATAIERIAAGEQNVLTAERVHLLEPTSGTTSGQKLVPFTESLRRQFQKAVAAWIANLLWHRPAIRRGRAYWSISPALGESRRTAGGIPVGFEDDAAYLGRLEQFALRRLLAVPSSIARISDIQAFRYATLYFLLRAEDLTLMSVWSPTFLTALLSPLEEWHERLCADIHNGTLRYPLAVLDGISRQPAVHRRPDSRRAAYLKNVFRETSSLAAKLQQIWPRLYLISCWTDAGSGRFLPGLRDIFPEVEIQPKGLLATEGCVSFPLMGRAAPALALRSHFFEFQEMDSTDEYPRIHLAHELEKDGRYRVILTTGGGFYRYQLHDEVQVIEFENQCPLLCFLGKTDQVSDLVGEKLAEAHVRVVLDSLFSEMGLRPEFALVVPVEGNTSHYRLYLQDPQLSNGVFLASSPEARLEAGLQTNPYYRQAIQLGQLAPVDIVLLPPNGKSAWSLYEERLMSLGQKAGNIKPAALDCRLGWAEVFESALTQRRSDHKPTKLQPTPGHSR
jgi:hypothetical protein